MPEDASPRKSPECQNSELHSPHPRHAANTDEFPIVTLFPLQRSQPCEELDRFYALYYSQQGSKPEFPLAARTVVAPQDHVQHEPTQPPFEERWRCLGEWWSCRAASRKSLVFNAF